MIASTSPPSVVPFCFNDRLIRTVSIDDSPWFVSKDVCDCLGISNSRQALSKIPENHKGVYSTDTLGGVQRMNIVDEPGLYRLIIRSDKPEAEPFMEWVTAEVLPTIRRTGAYKIQPEDKRVFVNHNRSTQAPGGLDIRYALDLTKLIQRPNKTTIALLERITGIQLSDVSLDGNFDKDSPIASFIKRNCRQADPEKHRVRIKEVYRQFVAFYKAEKNTLLGMPSKREVSIEMRQQGFEGRKVGGEAWIYGLQLAAEA